MIEEDEGMYDAITQYASQDKISYVHFRVRRMPPSTRWAIHPCGFLAPRNRPTPMRAPQNVIGQAPVFNEVFIDEGDVDMAKSIKAYKDAGFTGVMTPDHTPSVSAP